MDTVFRSLAFAFRNLAHPRILWLMIWPVVVALVLWGGVLIAFWARLVVWLGEKMNQWIATATFFVTWDASDVAIVTAKVFLILMLVPLVQLTALLVLGVFGMPAMVEHVSARAFPDLRRERGGSFAGSVWNSVVAVLGLVGLLIVSIPFWFLPPLWPVIPVAILGWVNQRVLRYDALAEHAAAAEMIRVFREQRTMLYLLGLILALVAYIPFIGFFAPVLFGLAIIHYLLGRLVALRAAPIAGERLE